MHISAIETTIDRRLQNTIQDWFQIISETTVVFKN